MSTHSFSRQFGPPGTQLRFHPGLQSVRDVASCLVWGTLMALIAGCSPEQIAHEAEQTDAAKSADSKAPSFDGRLALDLLNASIQTYRAYAGLPVTSPEGWTWSGQTFDGDDFFANTVSKKLFGVVMKKDSEPESLLFAFRGTDNREEWWDDLTVHPTTFKPQDSRVELSPTLHVEEGFDRVYQSMQESLFSIVDAEQPKTIYVTGHSLGAAICTLFAFDLQLSRPEITVVCFNFASPRVGNEEFVKKFSTLPGQTKNPLVRFVNSKDLVPKVPLGFEGYVHLPEDFIIHFESELESVAPAVWHSADNYYRVLQQVLDLPGVKAELFKTTPDPLKMLPDAAG